MHCIALSSSFAISCYC